VDKIVLLSHCGYSEDLAMAPKLRGVDVIVGGHSHTLLGTLDIPGFPKSGGPYPTVLKDADGKTVLVVQAWDWGMLLGRIKVTFDDAGVVKSWSDAAPLPVDETVAEDPIVKSMVAAFQRPIAAMQNEKVGSSTVALSRELMANLISDAMLDATRKMGSVAAFVNAGGVRAELDAGKLTFAQLVSVQPFENTLVVMDLTGAELAAAMQRGAESGGGMLLPSAGTSYRVADGKVTDIRVAGAPLDPAKTYTVTINNYTAAGGDAHAVLRDAKGKRTDTGLRDIDVLVDYVKAHSPLSPKPDKRITQ
jgi:5'-nucleotidase